MTSNPSTMHKTNPLIMLLIVAGFIALTAFIVISIGAQDPVWFTRGFEQEPFRVVVYSAGSKTEYLAGTPGYAELAAAVRSALNEGVDRPSSIGLSVESLNDAYNKYLTVEVFFDKQVKLHASFDTHHPNQMLFLITGRHSDLPIVFMGLSGSYYSNGPILKTTEPLRAALAKLGYNTTQP